MTVWQFSGNMVVKDTQKKVSFVRMLIHRRRSKNRRGFVIIRQSIRLEMSVYSSESVLCCSAIFILQTQMVNNGVNNLGI